MTAETRKVGERSTIVYSFDKETFGNAKIPAVVIEDVLAISVFASTKEMTQPDKFAPAGVEILPRTSYAPSSETEAELGLSPAPPQLFKAISMNDASKIFFNETVT